MIEQRRVAHRRGIVLVTVIGLGVGAGLITGVVFWVKLNLFQAPALVTANQAPVDEQLAEFNKSEVATTLESVAEDLQWPEDRLEGDEAKRFLLAYLQRARNRIQEIEGYSATMRRQERLGGKLGPEQRLQIKVRHQPFSIYLRFDEPWNGKEVLFVSGEHEGQLIAHEGDWRGRLFPRLKFDPNGPVVMSQNRHPITDAGIANLTERLLNYRKIDIGDPHAETILDRVTDEDGTVWYRSVHRHDQNDGVRLFALVKVLYDPVLNLPMQIWNYEWPESGTGPYNEDALKLAERYHFDEIDFDSTVTALDFDLDNPRYEFRR